MANLELLDPFGQYFPETIFDRLVHQDASATTICAFNRRATLMAAGTREGDCIVWDLDTKLIVLKLTGHVRQITSVSWTRRGQHILTASRDWNCILWDLATGQRQHTFKFSSPVLEGCVHPRNKNMFVAIATGDPPHLVHYSHDPLVPKKSFSLNVSSNDNESATNNQVYATTAIFSPDGERIYVGTTIGTIVIFDSNSGSSTNVIRLGSYIKQISFNHNGKELLVNSQDRVIRWYAINNNDGSIELELKNKFQDSVERSQWIRCCFSADSEYIVGALFSNLRHHVCIWDKWSGTLYKALEGPQEGLVDMVWHPYRPIVATISHFGNIYLWGVTYIQNYSAFAPSFKELEENTEYLEREDEFDLETEEADKKKSVMEVEVDQNIELDIICGLATQLLSDTDDDECDSVTTKRKPFVIPIRYGKCF